jgi:hypothetical protein
LNSLNAASSGVSDWRTPPPKSPSSLVWVCLPKQKNMRSETIEYGMMPQRSILLDSFKINKLEARVSMIRPNGGLAPDEKIGETKFSSDSKVIFVKTKIISIF